MERGLGTETKRSGKVSVNPSYIQINRFLFLFKIEQYMMTLTVFLGVKVYIFM